MALRMSAVASAVLLSSVLSGSAFAATAPAAPKDELAYSLGVRIGERLRDEVPALSVSDLLAGLQAAYQGQPLALDAAKIETLLAEHEAAQADSPAADARQQRQEAAYIAQFKARHPSARVLDGGVLVRELSTGRGPTPRADAMVTVRYSGKLADGSVFDASPEAVRFALASLIPGWRTALTQMPVGSHWEILIPSSQAYGAEGAGDVIPPYAPLLFDVLLEKAE